MLLETIRHMKIIFIYTFIRLKFLKKKKTLKHIEKRRLTINFQSIFKYLSERN